MRNTNRFLFLISILFINFTFGQQRVNNNSAIIYISALERNPTLIQYFHNEKLIGFTEKNQYIQYECEPGKQLFWSKIYPINKNSPKVESFLKINLEANKEYYFDTKTFTTNGKNIVKSFKKDKGNVVHKLVLLNDANSINEFKELISKKKPNRIKLKKLKKYNDELYAQITSSLYEYHKREGNSNSSINQTNTQEQSTELGLYKENQKAEVYSAYSGYSTEILEASKQKLLDSGNFAAAKILQDEINSREISSKHESENSSNVVSLNTEQSLEELEAAKSKAIEVEDYMLAKELKDKITQKKGEIALEKEQIALKKEQEKNSLENLIKDKENAIAEENYLLAEEINQKIKLQKKEKEQTNEIEEASFNEESNSEVGLSTLINTKNNTSLGNFTNKREESLAKFTKRKSTSANYSTTSFNSNYTSSYRTQKISKSENNINTDVSNYSRSSLYTLMLNNENREHANVIKDAFGNSPLQGKFNNHNIGPYLINIDHQEKDQSNLITGFLSRNDIAKEMVSKWFNRNEKGEFNMDLIAERGYYDASALDISIAKNSERGLAMLADAGEGLIGNTFVIVNDYKFTNKEEVAKKASKWLNALSSVAAYVPGGSTVSSAATYTSLGVSVIGKGYVIKTTSYLYRLVWDEETAAVFYNDYWIDQNDSNQVKKKAFENSTNFKLELVGSENAWADIQSTVFTKKSNEELIKIATIKATDKAIAKLQRKFEVFRTKSPLLSGDPITAKIGLKEGLEKGDKYEVLELVEDEEGNRKYKRVGVIKVDKSQIWNNQFMANEENSSQIEYTTFKGAKNKFEPGMLIRQIN